MNLLLLSPDEVDASGEVRLTDRRLVHAREVLRASTGDVLRVGVRDGLMGDASVLSVGETELHLRVRLADAPPPRPRVDLLLAIPRPKQLKRVLTAVSSLGADRVVLVNAARVEKSYFDSKVLNAAFIEELLVQGLEQARDTRAPQVLIRERFRPFVEDELDALFGESVRLLPHPPAVASLSVVPRSDSRVVVAVGPEGGWVPFEVELLAKQRFIPFSLGPRILRTEVAVPMLMGQLSLWRAQSS